MALFLHVADQGFDGGSAAQLSFDDAEDATLLAGDEDAAWLRRVVATISLVDVDPFDLATGEALGVFDGGAQGVAVVDPMGAVDSDRLSGRVRLLTHPLWRRPCML